MSTHNLVRKYRKAVVQHPTYFLFVMQCLSHWSHTTSYNAKYFKQDKFEQNEKQYIKLHQSLISLVSTALDCGLDDMVVNAVKYISRNAELFNEIPAKYKQYFGQNLCTPKFELYKLQKEYNAINQMFQRKFKFKWDMNPRIKIDFKSYKYIINEPNVHCDELHSDNYNNMDKVCGDTNILSMYNACGDTNDGTDAADIIECIQGDNSKDNTYNIFRQHRYINTTLAIALIKYMTRFLLYEDVLSLSYCSKHLNVLKVSPERFLKLRAREVISCWSNKHKIGVPLNICPSNQYTRDTDTMSVISLHSKINHTPHLHFRNHGSFTFRICLMSIYINGIFRTQLDSFKLREITSFHSKEYGPLYGKEIWIVYHGSFHY